jgi:hypothetical protein
MAKAFILGHGSRVPGASKTFVPEGRSLSFFSELDENTLRTVGLAALSAGDIKPTETFAAGAEVDNYYLSAFNDEEMAQHLASESSRTGGVLHFIGAGTLPDKLWLCTSDKCKAPKHSLFCKGIFKLVAEQELISVTCRGVWGQNSPSTEALGKDAMHNAGAAEKEDFVNETQAKGKELFDRSATEPEAVIQELESMTEATRQILYNDYTPLQRFAKAYYDQGGESTPAAILEARRTLEAVGEHGFVMVVEEQYDAKQKELVLTDPDLKDVYKRLLPAVQRERLLGEQVARQRSILEEAETEGETLAAIATQMGQTTATLTGSDADSDQVAALTTAFESFMQAVTVVQNIADKETLQSIQSLAARAYQAGADAAMALAVYSESMDTDNLPKFKTAIEQMLTAANELAGGITHDLAKL